MAKHRFVKGDWVIVSEIIFPEGGATRIKRCTGQIISGPHHPKGWGLPSSYIDYEVRLTTKSKVFGYQEGYARPSWMTHLR